MKHAGSIQKTCLTCGSAFAVYPYQIERRAKFCSRRCVNNRHGHARAGKPSPTWRSWQCMRSRCERAYSTSFQNYGGRGIRVCGRWLKFENFLADMGERPPGTSIDRVDSNGDYEPGNCRWATDVEQGRNTSRNRLLSVDGTERCTAEWAQISGISGRTICKRLSLGWEVKQAIFSPVRQSYRRRA